MEHLLNRITGWLYACFELLAAIADAAISILEWPARELGIPSEVIVVGLICAVLIVLWRAMSIRWY